MKYLLYLRYLLKHKWYVFLKCCEYGIVWRGITHDVSKFLPDEFFPYANYFFGGVNLIGSKKMCSEIDNFRVARNLHYKRNEHHLTMPDLPASNDVLLEMVADWFGAAYAQGKPHTMLPLKLHRENSKKIEFIFKNLSMR